MEFGLLILNESETDLEKKVNTISTNIFNLVFQFGLVDLQLQSQALQYSF